MFGDAEKQVPLTDYVWFQEGPGVRSVDFTEEGTILLTGSNINDNTIDNLVRLGLLQRSNNEWIADDSLYEPLNAHPFITGLQLQILSNPEINKEVKNIELAKGYIKLTSFGKSFCFVCLNVQNQAQIEIKKVEM